MQVKLGVRSPLNIYPGNQRLKGDFRTTNSSEVKEHLIDCGWKKDSPSCLAVSFVYCKGPPPIQIHEALISSHIPSKEEEARFEPASTVKAGRAHSYVEASMNL
ncbi:hypothetical protein J6590_062687 [Homalodisca vitripennis]|nr:hypothetical protein J6590_062687 [Homalodisca vitripennis]